MEALFLQITLLIATLQTGFCLIQAYNKDLKLTHLFSRRVNSPSPDDAVFQNLALTYSKAHKKYVFKIEKIFSSISNV